MSNSGFDLNFHDDLCDEHFSHTCLSFVYFILKNVPYPLIIDFSGFLFSYCNSLHMTYINSLSHSYKTVLFLFYKLSAYLLIVYFVCRISTSVWCNTASFLFLHLELLGFIEKTLACNSFTPFSLKLFYWRCNW